ELREGDFGLLVAGEVLADELVQATGFLELAQLDQHGHGRARGLLRVRQAQGPIAQQERLAGPEGGQEENQTLLFAGQPLDNGFQGVLTLPCRKLSVLRFAVIQPHVIAQGLRDEEAGGVEGVAPESLRLPFEVMAEVDQALVLDEALQPYPSA